VLYILAKLCIPDKLAAGPKTAEQLAADTGVLSCTPASGLGLDGLVVAANIGQVKWVVRCW